MAGLCQPYPPLCAAAAVQHATTTPTPLAVIYRRPSLDGLEPRPSTLERRWSDAGATLEQR